MFSLWPKIETHYEDDILLDSNGEPITDSKGRPIVMGVIETRYRHWLWFKWKV